MKGRLLLILFLFSIVNCKAQTCYSLFDSLKSREDKRAFDAYVKLTLYEPDSIENAQEQHLRGDDYISDFEVNDTIPSFWSRFLPQQASLISYCKQNHIAFTLKESIQNLLNRLNSSIIYSERYHTENLLIDSIGLKDITGVEYWATLICDRNGKSSALADSLSVSIARIVDIFYNRYWQQIIKNRQQLRLFLKKSKLFEMLGIIGECNNYLVKFSRAKNDVLDSLKVLLQGESDTDIRQQAQRVLNGNYANREYNIYSKLNNPKQTIPLNQYLVNSNDYIDDLSANVQIDTASRKDYNLLVNYIIHSSNEKEILRFLDIIDHHPSPYMVPELMRLFNDDFVARTLSSSYLDPNMMTDHWVMTDITVADEAIGIISRYYQYWFPAYKQPPKTAYKGKYVASMTEGNNYASNYHLCAPYWLEMWAKDSQNVMHWGRELFVKKIDDAEKKDKIDMFDLNVLWQSSYQLPEDHSALLGLLSKAPANEFRDFKLKDNDSLHPQDLTYLDKIDLNYDGMDNILNKIASSNNALVLEFIKKQCAKMKFDDRATVYSYIGSYVKDWYSNIPKDTAWRKQIVKTLEKYLKKLSKEEDREYEYDEAEPVIFELKDEHRNSFVEKIKAIKDSKYKSKDKLIGFAVEKLVYDSLPCLFSIYKMGMIKSYDLYKYIDKDLGFMLPDDKLATIDEFMSNYYKMDEQALYGYYLDKAGILYKKPDGQLDFQKIDSILYWDDVPSAFVGSTNGACSEYLPSIIRELEFTLHTRLGHNKLFNHELTGTFDGLWCSDWVNYLEEHKLAVPCNSVPSFSKGN